jgi:glycosyltransferase involved in cell wall biosynthesis
VTDERPGSPLRILLVNDHLGWGEQIHGVARLFELWASHLDAERFSVSVLILRAESGLARIFTERGIPIRFLGRGRYDPATLLDLLRIIRDERVDVLHLQGYGGSTFGRLAARLTGTPALVHFHDTTPNYPFVQHVADLALRGSARSYLAVSESARDCWARRAGLAPERVRVLHNCLDVESFRALEPARAEAVRRRLDIPPAAPVVGTVTRLFEEKGTRSLVEAAPRLLERHPELHFVVAGDGPLRAELEGLAARLGVARRFRFTGFLADVAPVLGSYDVFALTSWFAEGGCPLPVLEAMAMARPLVVTDVVDILRDGQEALVIPPRQPDRLADGVSRLLLEPALRAQLVERALQRVRGFDVRPYVRQLGALYEALARRR